MKAIEQLEDYAGETFMYRSNVLTIKAVISKESQVIVKTSYKRFTMAESEVSEFIEELLPVAADSSIEISKQANEVSTRVTNLFGILEGNLQKIQDDPDYIKQAKAINDTINTTLKAVTVSIKLQKQINNN